MPLAESAPYQQEEDPALGAIDLEGPSTSQGRALRLLDGAWSSAAASDRAKPTHIPPHSQPALSRHCAPATEQVWTM